MKAVFVLIAIVALAQAGPTQEKARIWENYKETHSKVYADAEEEALRQNIFFEKLAAIEEHNERYAKGEFTYTIGINQFSDMTDEEFEKTLGLKVPENLPASEYVHQMSGIEAPSSMDWRTKGVIGPVKNQGSCGSCWAFAANGALEPQVAIHKGQHVSLSEQNLVDCVKGNDCNGGWMTTAYQYIVNNGGIDTERSYPYEARNNVCRYNAANRGASMSRWVDLPQRNEGAMIDALATVGPLATAIEVSGNFNGYSSGIYYNTNCGHSLNHGVTIVGYGVENNMGYFLVRNSWGSGWGMSGYIKMARGVARDCGIMDNPSYPVL